MNRDIKFRAWDGTKLREVTSINFSEKKAHFGDGEWGKLKDCPLVQYTGLKDKNGTECYEGDIIRDSEDDRVYQVKWHDDVDYPAFDTDPIHSNGDSNGFSYMALGGDGFEVIGNIYENPELTKGEQNG